MSSSPATNAAKTNRTSPPVVYSSIKPSAVSSNKRGPSSVNPTATTKDIVSDAHPCWLVGTFHQFHEASKRNWKIYLCPCVIRNQSYLANIFSFCHKEGRVERGKGCRAGRERGWGGVEGSSTETFSKTVECMTSPLHSTSFRNCSTFVGTCALFVFVFLYFNDSIA